MSQYWIEGLQTIVEEKLGPWQHGIRRGKGATDMTFVLSQLMEKQLRCIWPSLDLQKHFFTEYHVNIYRTQWWRTKYHQH